MGKSVEDLILCTAPHHDRFAITIKHVVGGTVSNYISDNLKRGDTINVMVPQGNLSSFLTQICLGSIIFCSQEAASHQLCP